MKRFLQYSSLILVLPFFGLRCAQADGAADSNGPSLPKNLSHVKFSDDDGSICQKAIVITEAANNSEGVAAEKAWIAWKYPSAKIKAQAVSGAKSKTFDTLEIKTVSGETKALCFDITDFFGRW
ncbi:MAG: hypothetical protein JNM60_05440 [Candidatus Competibacteraceae bacterium]|nr:hypothetical protein [Candidatus Competibacteraceae bacterium]